MNVFEKNLSFFKEKSKPLYDTLTMESSQFDSEVEFTDGFNLKVNHDGRSCFTHSLYNRNRELLEMFSSTDENAERIIIFGAGLGIYAGFLGRYTKLKHIIIIEPDLNIFKAMLQAIDIMDLMTKADQVTFIINKTKEFAVNTLWTLIKENLTMKMSFAYSLSYRSLYLGYYEYINDSVTEMVRNYLINTATNDHFIYLWSKNALTNCKHTAIPLSRFIDAFNQIPVVIVSAGPSLNHTMHHLKEVRNRALIIAVGAAIKILDSNGILPHFRLALDGSDNEMKIFKDIDTAACPVIFSDYLYPPILDDYKGAKIRMVLDSDSISQYIFRKLYNENILFESGFSVANVGLNIALKLGFKKIIFMGQDLCYTEGSLYAKGSWKTDDGNIDFRDDQYIPTTNSMGNPVYTSKVFLGMKSLFEKKIASHPKASYVNITGRGLNIDGAINKPIKVALEEDLKDSYLIDEIVGCIINENESLYNDYIKLEQIMSDIAAQVQFLIETNTLRYKRIKKVRKYLTNGVGLRKIQGELDYLESTQESLNGFPFYRNVVAPSLTSRLTVLRMKYSYAGEEQNVLIENKIEYMLSEIVEVKQYLAFLQGMLEGKK